MQGPVLVPRSMLGAHYSARINDAWDAKEAEESAREQQAQAASNPPAKPAARALPNRSQGSAHHPRLAASARARTRTGANNRAFPSAPPPAISEPSMLASAIAALSDKATSGIGASPARVAEAMATGVNGTERATFEKSKEPAEPTYSNAAPQIAVMVAAQRQAARERARLKRFMFGGTGPGASAGAGAWSAARQSVPARG